MVEPANDASVPPPLQRLNVTECSVLAARIVLVSSLKSSASRGLGSNQ
jgi:hypothetical protein